MTDENKTKKSSKISATIEKAAWTNVNGGTLRYNVNNPDFRPEQQKKKEPLSTGRISSNVLHSFASYSTLFTLSGLSEKEIKDQSYLTNTPHDIIARSGGISDPNISKEAFHHQQDIGTTEYTAPGIKRTEESIKHTKSYWDSAEILSKGLDLFFENINIISTVGPNPERGLANFTKMEFELHEPFGITLLEKLRGSAFINGFKDYQDAPFLLTIKWVGNDQISGSGTPWTYEPQAIEINDRKWVAEIVRKIPILISRIEFDVDQGGAKYSGIAVPYGDLAFDDRFKFPRANLNFSSYNLLDKTVQTATPFAGYGTYTSTSPGWISTITELLDKQMEDEKKDGTREINDKYIFKVHPDVLTYGREYLNDVVLAHSDDTKNIIQKLGEILFPDSNFAKNLPQVNVKLNLVESYGDKNTSLSRLFEDAIRTLVGYQELVERFWYTWGHGMMKDRGESTKTEGAILDYIKSKEFEVDLEKNQFVNWFMIKPNVNTNYLAFDKIRKVHPKTITYFAIPTKIHILKFIKPGVSFGNVNWDKYVRKQYDYIYTGNNVDVQSLKIFYKAAYFLRNVRPISSTIVKKGSWRDISQKLEEKINQVLGHEDYPFPEPLLPLRQEPSLLQGRSTVSSADAGAHKSQEFYDYITNPQVDMMRIELEILGDPAYISQDMFTTIPVDTPKANPHTEGLYNDENASFNAEQYQPLIKVNYRLPDEINLKEGLMFEKQLSVGESLFFNGIYQVTRVDSRFQNGEFTQVLTCVRLNNQKGTGEEATFSLGDKEKFGFNTKEVKENLPNKNYKKWFGNQYGTGTITEQFDKMEKLQDDINAKIKARKLKDSLIK